MHGSLQVLASAAQLPPPSLLPFRPAESEPPHRRRETPEAERFIFVLPRTSTCGTPYGGRSLEYSWILSGKGISSAPNGIALPILLLKRLGAWWC